MSFYKEQLKNWLSDKFLSGEKVLSIGAMNDDRKYFKGSEIGIYKTFDIDSQYKPDILGDINESILIKETFDHVLAFELFEYLWNPIHAFNNLNNFLKIGGTLWLSVPFLYPTHNPTDQDFLRVTESGIKKILQETGFKIVEFEYRVWKDPGGWNEAVSEDGMRFAKDYKHHNATGFLIQAIKI